MRREPAAGRIKAALCVSLLIIAGSVALASSGRVDGRVLRPDGSPLAGVVVAAEALSRTDITDSNGRYDLGKVPAGIYDLSFRGGEQRHVERIEVVDDERLSLRTTLDWEPMFFATATVTTASRRRERIVEAPAAVTTLSPAEIEHQSLSGQLPKAVEFTPGVELSQSDLYDFNLNTRGFNSMLNRRVLVLIDGRESSVPEFLGVQEWGSLSIPLDDFTSVEFARGPGSALYGAGAVNGVLSFRTKDPRDHPGGRLRVSGGELDTQRADFRHAGRLAERWYYRLSGGYQQSDHFTRSRVVDVEYAPLQLPRELVAPPWERVKTSSGSLRVDGYFGEADQRALVLEVGHGEFRGGTTIAPLGRTQAHQVKRPWARLNFNTPRWNLMGYYSGRDGSDQVGLGSGQSLYSRGSNIGFELQGNVDFSAGRGRLIGGATYGRQRIDSRNPLGVHGIFSGIETANRRALFGQLEYELRSDLKTVVSARWDSDTLHDDRISPRVALVYRPAERHTLRFSYNDAFQSATLVESMVRTAVGAPLDLSAVEDTLAPILGGVDLGFEEIPRLALGNRDLEVERIRSYEIGYTAVLANAVYLTINAYDSKLDDFVTGLLPQVGTSLGRLNPTFGPYAPPAELSAAATDAVLTELENALSPEEFAQMSNDVDGAPIFGVLSLTNFGRADSQGLETAVTYFFRQGWRFDFSYSLFDGDVGQSAPENLLLPNSPERQFASGLSYSGRAIDAGVRYRWVDRFDSASGLFVGTVRSYGVADLTARVSLGESWSVRLDATNLLDDEHYEVFGGNLLSRRVLVELEYSW